MSSLRGDVQIVGQEMFVSSSTQQTDLGARVTTGDGRVFRYALGSATALVAGKLCSAVPPDTTNFQLLGVTALSTTGGTNSVQVTIGSSITLAANQLSGGFLTVARGGGAGFTYGIKSNPAITAGTLVLTLSDQIQAGFTTTTQVNVTPNLYSGVVVSPTSSSIPVGVAVNNTAANQYGWVQTRGLCNVLTAGTTTVGSSVAPSLATAGAVALPANGSLPLVGFATMSGTSTDYDPVYLMIE